MEITTLMSVEEVIDLLNNMMPDDEIVPEIFEGTDIVDAIEYGEKKQRWRERLIYQRAIDDLKDKL